MFGKNDGNILMLLGLVPLFAALHTHNSYTVLLDLSVWLVTVFSFYWLIKTPFKLYFLAKERNKFAAEDGSENQDIILLETRLYYACLATPLMAILGWLTLEEFCFRYHISPLSAIIHPYFILLVSLIAAVAPMLNYYTSLERKIKGKYFMAESNNVSTASNLDEVEEELKEIRSVLTTREAAFQELALKHQTLSTLTEKQMKRVVQEIQAIKKTLTGHKSESSGGALSGLEGRVVALENQLEIVDMLVQHHSSQPKQVRKKSILDMLPVNPMRMFGSDGAEEEDDIDTPTMNKSYRSASTNIVGAASR